MVETNLSDWLAGGCLSHEAGVRLLPCLCQSSDRARVTRLSDLFIMRNDRACMKAVSHAYVLMYNVLLLSSLCVCAC